MSDVTLYYVRTGGKDGYAKLHILPPINLTFSSDNENDEASEYIIAKLSRLKYFQEPYQVLGSWYRSAANMTDPKPLILRSVQRLHKLVNELKMGTKESQLMKSNT